MRQSRLRRKSLQWRHNEYDGVSNHQPHDCLLNRLFRRRSKKISKLRVTGICEGDFTGDFEDVMYCWTTSGSYPNGVTHTWDLDAIFNCSCAAWQRRNWLSWKCLSSVIPLMLPKVSLIITYCGHSVAIQACTPVEGNCVLCWSACSLGKYMLWLTVELPVIPYVITYFHKSIRSCVENECCCPRTVNISNVNFTSKISIPPEPVFKHMGQEMSGPDSSNG